MRIRTFRRSGPSIRKSTLTTSRSEVAVVGAGPAGAAAALLLARRGVGVTLFERAQFPRRKICGEYLSSGAVRLLQDLGVAARVAPAAYVLDGVRLHVGGAMAQMRFSRPAWSLPRAELDAALVEAALEAGATLVQGRFEALHFDGGEAVLSVRCGSRMRSHRAAFVIGADGMHSAVARKCGLVTPFRTAASRYAAGGHYGGFRNLGRFVEMFVDGPRYFAVNPFSPSSANVMAVAPQMEFLAKRDTGLLMSELAHRSGAASIGYDDAVLDGERLATGPLSYRAGKLAFRRVLFAGDAARLVDPFSGQGVFLALYTARLAAEAIAAVLREGGAAPRAFHDYRRLAGGFLQQRSVLAACAAAAAHLPVFAPVCRLFAPLVDAVAA